MWYCCAFCCTPVRFVGVVSGTTQSSLRRKHVLARLVYKVHHLRKQQLHLTDLVSSVACQEISLLAPARWNFVHSTHSRLSNVQSTKIKIVNCVFLMKAGCQAGIKLIWQLQVHCITHGRLSCTDNNMRTFLCWNKQSYKMVTVVQRQLTWRWNVRFRCNIVAIR